MKKYIVEMEVTKTYTVEFEMEAEDEGAVYDDAEDDFKSGEHDFHSEEFMADEQLVVLSVTEKTK
jgi:hypothetical protein